MPEGLLVPKWITDELDEFYARMKRLIDLANPPQDWKSLRPGWQPHQGILVTREALRGAKLKAADNLPPLIKGVLLVESCYA
jgi:hypothetical protein